MYAALTMTDTQGAMISRYGGKRASLTPGGYCMHGQLTDGRAQITMKKIRRKAL
jgi:hypothetical protein